MLDRSHWLRFAPLAVALMAVAPLQACFGKFALVNTLYDVNKNVSDSYVVQEIVFLLFAILQVYTVVGFIDAFILNPIELITGTNPISAGMEVGEVRQVAMKGGGKLILTRTADGMQIEQIRKGEHRFYEVRDTESGLQLTDETGETLAATVRLDDGTFQVVDDDGRVLAHPGRAMLASMGRALWSGDTSTVVAIATADAGPDACLLAH